MIIRKTVLAKMMFMFTTSVALANDLEIAHRYQKILEANEIENDKVQVKKDIGRLLSDVNSEHELFDEIYETYLDINEGNIAEQIKLLFKQVSGSKSEVFCKNIGLMQLSAKFDSGNEMQLDFSKGQRVLAADSYSLLESGKWEYQWTEGQTKHKANLTLQNSDKNQLELIETEANAKNDKIKWKFSNSHEKYEQIFQELENEKKLFHPSHGIFPLLAWGGGDLGRFLTPSLAAEQVFKEKYYISTKYGKIGLKAKRKVVENHKEIELQGNKYLDCVTVLTEVKVDTFKPVSALAKVFIISTKDNKAVDLRDAESLQKMGPIKILKLNKIITNATDLQKDLYDSKEMKGLSTAESQELARKIEMASAEAMKHIPTAEEIKKITEDAKTNMLTPEEIEKIKEDARKNIPTEQELKEIRENAKRAVKQSIVNLEEAKRILEEKKKRKDLSKEELEDISKHLKLIDKALKNLK